jgi:hypothetical protein
VFCKPRLLSFDGMLPVWYYANAFENRRTQNNGFLVENVGQNAEERGTFEGPLCLECNSVLEKHAHECHRGTAE